MAEVKREDIEKVKTWYKLGLLIDVNDVRLKELCQDGLILLGCGDGDQTPDLFQYLTQKVECMHRPHLHMLNGGPIRLVDFAPIPKEYRIHKQLLPELMQSRKLKRISTIVLCSHYPCGMAEESKIDLPWIIKYNLSAAQSIKNLGWDTKKVVTLFHCDHGENKKKTYFINAKKEGVLFPS